MSAGNKSYPLIPEEERKCVWMTTGLISYKLCDRGYQCEVCPFDQAMKNEGYGEAFQSEEDWAEESCDAYARIDGSVFYHPDHCWAKVESPEKVRIGIVDLLSRLITEVKVVILPQVGSFTGQGECCAHIIREDYILPVISPLSGSIQAVNTRLKKEPWLITGDPVGEGWLMTLKPENLEGDLKNLLFGRKALFWYQREEKEIMARTDLLLRRDRQSLGPTMQDGGVRIDSLQDMLDIANPKQKIQILDFSVNKPKKMPAFYSSTPHRNAQV